MPLYNAINWDFGARFSDGDAVYADRNPPDNAVGGSDSIPQMTVLVTTIASFLCPSDGNPGSSGTFLVGGQERLVGASNYACNIGLNRRIDGGRPDATWKLNGPNYVASRWDTSVNQTTDLTTFLDGTSNTAIFSEWIKGQAVPTGLSRNGLLEVYNLGENSDFYPTDQQFMQLCNAVPITSFNQQWQWKGEWWAFGGTMIYSHTQTPNRTALRLPRHQSGYPRHHHHDRGQLQPPGRRQRAVHGRHGPVRQELGALQALVCHRDPEIWRGDQL